MKRSRFFAFSSFIVLFAIAQFSGCFAVTQRSVTAVQANPVKPGADAIFRLDGFPANKWATVDFGTNDQYSRTDVFINVDGVGATWHTFPCNFVGQVKAWPKDNPEGITPGVDVRTTRCPQNQMTRSSKPF